MNPTKPLNRSALAILHRQRAAAMLAQGLTPRQVSERLGLHIDRVRKLRQEVGA